MRYLYVKDGDAVGETRRALTPGNVIRSGTGFYVADFIRAHAGDDLSIVCSWPQNDSFVCGSVRAESVAVAKGNPVVRVLSRGRSFLHLCRRIRSWRPQRILCGQSGELLWACALMSSLLRIPLVHARHNEMQRRRGLGWVSAALDRVSIRSCAAVVCHGQFLVDQVKGIGVDAARIEEFKLPVQDFAKSRDAPVPEELSKFRSRRPFTLMFVGRLQRDKGVFDLLEAFRKVDARHADRVGLVYVGNGNDLAAVQQQVQQQGLDAKVLFLGRLLHEQLPSVMSAATVMVAPTRREFPEGRCMSIIESLVLGVPVIAPDFGPFPYAVRHEANGLLFEPDNVESLENSIERLVRERQLLETLTVGATESGCILAAEPHRSFSEAVTAAFRKAG